MNLCVYAPGPWGECLDTGCYRQGGRCQYVGPPGRSGCRCVLATPSPNRAETGEGEAMDTDLGEYRRVVDQQPACDEAWFAERLARLRSGDEAAGREISGSCLRLALRLAEEMPNPPASWSLLDLIQEANAGLVEGLTSFTGTSAAEFLQHAGQTITRRLGSLPQQVG